MSDPLPPAMAKPVGLSVRNLGAPKEDTYFALVLAASILIWLGIALTLIGIIYALFIAFFLWLGNGLLAAYLRAEAVRVSPEQLPELDRTFKEVCARLEIKNVPALYVLQSGGLLNAFAMRFAGRNFVVMYSDLLEALGPQSPETRFILGHEIGHIQSRHILKQIFLAPGLFCPLIGPAYRRAWETSCDRYGTFAADDVDSSVRAMLILSGGREYGRRLNPAAFAGQHRGERGFFVSLHELTSTYPTLSRRVIDLESLRLGTPAPRESRHPCAYVLAFLMPGGGATAGGPASSLLVMMVVVGILAATALPAVNAVRTKAEAQACINHQRMLASAADQHALEHGKGVASWEDIIGPGKLISQMPVCPKGGSYHADYDRETRTHAISCTVLAHDPSLQPERH